MFHFDEIAEEFEKKEFWMKKFKNALLLRDSFVKSNKTNTYRLIHAEGDFMPGVIIDIYDNTASVQLLIKGTEKLSDVFIDILKDLGFKNVYLKNKISAKVIENVELANGWLTNNESESIIEVSENRLKFLVDVEKGQKTGFFIDQRENRGLLRKYAKGKKVLNTFCYTGGFSVYAMAGGAKLVHSVDISKDAVAMCDKNITLNFGDTNNHQSFAADCFDFLKKSTEDYDIIILDPPAFAKNAKSVNQACRGYKELNLSALKRIKPGGLIFTYSCSQNISKDLFQKIIFGAAVDAKRNVRIIKHMQQPIDHPINIFHPESEYLKGFIIWVE